MNLSVTYQGLTLLIAEDIALVLLFVLLNRVFGVLIKRVSSIASLQRYRWISDALQRRIRSVLMALTLVSVLVTTAFNSYLIFVLQTDVLAYDLRLFTSLPPHFWTTLGVSAFEISVLIIVARWVSKLLARALSLMREHTLSIARLETNSDSITTFFEYLDRLRLYCFRLLVLAMAAQLSPLPAVIAAVLFTILRMYLIIALSRLLVIAAVSILKGLDELSLRYGNLWNIETFGMQIRSFIPLLTRTVEYIIYVSAATMVVSQVSAIAQFAAYGPKLITLIGLFFLSHVLVEVAYLVVDKLLLVQEGLTDIQWRQRLTLTPLIKSVARYVIYFGAFLIGLEVFGINTTPILAGIGGAGLIVGLGAQPVINDLVSGVFVLFENLYLVGDHVRIGKAQGIVEAIDIRTTRIRNEPGGQLHIIRNGQISDVVNFSKEYVFAVIDVHVNARTDLNRVFAILHDVGIAQQVHNTDVLEPARILGVKELGTETLIVSVAIKAKPAKHAAVGFDYRKLIKEAFEREAIVITSLAEKEPE